MDNHGIPGFISFYLLFCFRDQPPYFYPMGIFFPVGCSLYQQNINISIPSEDKRQENAYLSGFYGILFNLINAFINSYFLRSLSGKYELSWLYDPRFVTGAVFFLGGLIINWQSDNILIHLRKPGETGYFIPRGGLFNYISCPNHFSEIIEWTGFALMTWSLPGLAFATWTLVNLLPRALHHHKWYKQTFPDYPVKRKALIPFII